MLSTQQVDVIFVTSTLCLEVDNGLDVAPGGTSFLVPQYIAKNPTFRVGSAGTHMPIRLVVANSENSYLATDAGILVDAFEGALSELGVVDRNDPAALVVANHIIAFAKAGVLDPVRLRDLTVKAVQKEWRRQPTHSP
jgi:hypothetical protein